jgi:hypothetical protein
VQLQLLLLLLRQRVVVTAQKAQADVLLQPTPPLRTTRYRGGTPLRRGAMRKTTPQPSPGTGKARACADGEFDADHGFGLDGVGWLVGWLNFNPWARPGIWGVSRIARTAFHGGGGKPQPAHVRVGYCFAGRLVSTLQNLAGYRGPPF